jgi:hypothetical protein
MVVFEKRGFLFYGNLLSLRSAEKQYFIGFYQPGQ